jgi:hypothetical protein
MSDGNILVCDLSDYNVPKLAAVKSGELSEGMLVEELEGSELVTRDVRVLRSLYKKMAPLAFVFWDAFRGRDIAITFATGTGQAPLAARFAFVAFDTTDCGRMVGLARGCDDEDRSQNALLWPRNSAPDFYLGS